MADQQKKKPLVLKQKVMLQVVYTLIPLAAASIYFFGWRSLVILAVVNCAGFLTEFIMVRRAGQQVSSAVFVTNFIYALSLPPTVPLWIAVVGIVFGVLFGKMVFGGFGRNIFNPALAGRAFVYISFGLPLTGRWAEPVQGIAGGFAAWQADVVTKATPLVKLASGESVSRISLFLGNVSGSLGETSALLILVLGIILMIQKAASFRIVLGGAAGFLVMQIIFFFIGAGKIFDPLSSVLAGSFLFGLMFCITDPISASQTTNQGRWIYGSIFGVLCSLIRVFSSWPAAVTFAVLFANTFAPLLDHLMKQAKKKRKTA